MELSDNPSLAVVQSEAKHVAQRLFQKVLHSNPPKEWFDVAVPIIATAILEGRADIVAQASTRIADLERRLKLLKGWGFTCSCPLCATEKLTQ